ncbi:hypothetical protein Tco_0652136 [Tanacetum coccineum]|uniref:Uncharacterized protein n=1 Tax=Tanacetum coccineum TaxID=301880 RepID=A0ABQ4WWS4_9ASTR
MDTGASSHLNSSVNNLSTIFNSRIYQSVLVGDGKSIPVTNTGHSTLPTPYRTLHLNNVLITPNIVKLNFYKKINESQDISVLSNLVEKLMKEIEFLRKENSILKKEDNPKRKAIASECKSEESSDRPIPTIKTQDIVKKTYEISHCSPIKEDMFKTHMFVSNRGNRSY